MAHFVGIGIATIDVISVTENFPAEDSEVRALSRQTCRGGNVTNTLVVLSQYGHHCTWAGTLGDDTAAKQIRHDLQTYQINTSPVRTVSGSATPTSLITLNLQNGSRTIVHFRDLPEYRFDDFKNLDLDSADWLHFEGRNVDEVGHMIRVAKHQHPTLPVSVEIEKPRENIETLFDGPDVLLFSKQFAQSRGFTSAQTFLQEQHKQLSSTGNTPLMVCTWADEGAWTLEAGHVLHAPAIKPARIVDSIGAGDTFNAAFIHEWQQHRQTQTALDKACKLAGKKCGQFGFAQLVNSTAASTTNDTDKASSNTL